MFGPVDWPGMWTALETSIRDMHDFRVGSPFERKNNVRDDLELLRRILCLAVDLGAGDLRMQTSNGMRGLVRFDAAALVADVIEDLLTSGIEARSFAMEVLVQVAHSSVIEARFLDGLQALADDPDEFVARAAYQLGEIWGVPLSKERTPLPSFYSLELAATNATVGKGLIDERTRSLVVEEPFAWTEPWLLAVRKIAEAADVSMEHVRHRVAQFVGQAGGLDEFGRTETMERERRLYRLDMRITYMRPQAVVTTAALRQVIGELRRCGRLNSSEVFFLLDHIASMPSRPVLRTRERPPYVKPPLPSGPSWTNEEEEWLTAVEMDAATACRTTPQFMLGGWRRFHVRRYRKDFEWSALIGRSIQSGAETVVLAMMALPTVAFMDGPVPFYDPSTADPSHLARLPISRMNGWPNTVLIFCPIAAERLGWIQERRSPDRYRGSNGELMAHTELWRDGIEQSVADDARFAFGQEVILTRAGLDEYKTEFGRPLRSAVAWRRLDDDERRGQADGRSAVCTLQ